MLPPQLQQTAQVWSKLQQNGEKSYQLSPELNLFALESDYSSAIRNFLEVRGSLLDVGCGPWPKIPAYIPQSAHDSYQGIDPLSCTEKKEYRFCQALAELLPFQNRTFDNVSFVSCLDHMLNFREALAEGARVLKQDGKMYLVFDDLQNSSGGVIDTISRALKQLFWGLRNWGLVRTMKYLKNMLSLVRPSGAADIFHLSFPSALEIEATLSAHKLRVSRRSKHRSMILLEARFAESET